MNSEQNLIGRAKKREQDALIKLYKGNFQSLYKFIRHKVESNEIAEDLCAETFTRAFEKLESFKGNSTFKSWTYAIAKNLIIDWYKNKSKTLNNNEFIEEAAESIVHEANRDTESKLQSILNKLPENYKNVLEMRFLMNMNIKECAEAIGTSESNVKVLQNRAIKKAQNIINLK